MKNGCLSAGASELNPVPSIEKSKALGAGELSGWLAFKKRPITALNGARISAMPFSAAVRWAVIQNLFPKG
jgi:hypothetical protein